MLEIRKSKIGNNCVSISDTSERYGKYDGSVVRSIIERYISENLPGYSIKIL